MAALSGMSGASGLSALVASGFDPRAFPGLLLDVEPARGRYQDAAGTTAATADGDPLGLLQDGSGNSCHVSQAVAAKRPTLKQVTNGGVTFWAARFDGVDDYLAYAVSAAFDTAALTVYAVYSGNGVNDFYRGLVSSGSVPAAGTDTRFCFTTNHGVMNQAGVTSNGQPPPLSVEVVTFMGDSAAVSFFTNGTAASGNPYGIPAIASSATGQALNVGYGGQNYAVMDLARLLVYGEAHTPAQRQAVERALGPLYGVTVA